MVITTVVKHCTLSWVWRSGNPGLGGVGWVSLIAVAIDQNNVLVDGFGVLKKAAVSGDKTLG